VEAPALLAEALQAAVLHHLQWQQAGRDSSSGSSSSPNGNT
jgi:hypothetical protein